MITQINSIEELKQIWIEILLNKTSKVTKVEDESVLNGVAYGCAKIGQKALKDIAIIESHIFPDTAYGSYLDNIASNYGIAARFGASQSSTYIRLVGNPGTNYLPGVNTFTGNEGVVFDLEEDILIGSLGYTYAKIRSQDTGLKTNVNALSINKVSPLPTGHKYCINEYAALGGRDIESDELFKIRIKQGSNVLARGTISMLEQVFMKINSNILRVYYNGTNNQGQVVLGVLTQNGINLTAAELSNLLIQGSEFLSLTELKVYGTQSYGILLQNIQYQTIDLSFRVELFSGYNPDEIRKEIQIKLTKQCDFRFWVAGDSVQWEDLLFIIKNVKGVKYCPDQYFYPRTDISIDKDRFPRFRSFIMMDLNGNIISNISGTLNPVYYPNKPDWSYQQSVISSI